MTSTTRRCGCTSSRELRVVSGLWWSGCGEGSPSGGAGGLAVFRSVDAVGVTQASVVLPWMRGRFVDGRRCRIAPRRAAMTEGAGRWCTEQVGRLGRTVAEVARELGCRFHGRESTRSQVYLMSSHTTAWRRREASRTSCHPYISRWHGCLWCSCLSSNLSSQLEQTGPYQTPRDHTI